MYKSLADAISDAESRGQTLASVALEAESRDQGRPQAEIRAALTRVVGPVAKRARRLGAPCP